MLTYIRSVIKFVFRLRSKVAVRLWYSSQTHTTMHIKHKRQIPQKIHEWKPKIHKPATVRWTKPVLCGVKPVLSGVKPVLSGVKPVWACWNLPWARIIWKLLRTLRTLPFFSPHAKGIKWRKMVRFIRDKNTYFEILWYFLSLSLTNYCKNVLISIYLELQTFFFSFKNQWPVSRHFPLATGGRNYLFGNSFLLIFFMDKNYIACKG